MKYIDKGQGLQVAKCFRYNLYLTEKLITLQIMGNMVCKISELMGA